LIYGQVGFPKLSRWGPSISYSKTIYTFSDTTSMTELIEKYPKVFKYGCQNGVYKVSWIKNLRLLEKISIDNKNGR
jgi:hypothetical protein